MKPGFFIIGAARSGTTSLYAYLDQHPEIFFSQVKEINFFSNPRIWKKGFGWYEGHFKRVRGEKIAGEASTSYASSPFLSEAAARLAKYNQNAKLIYIVRDPIDRFVSHYMHRVHNGVESRTVSEIINNLQDEPTAWQGRYHYQLQQYLKVFDRGQILVLSFDDLNNSTESVIEQVFRFLGVDSEFKVAEPEKIYNSSSVTLRRSDFGKIVLRIYRRHVEQRGLPFTFKKQFFNLAKIGAVRHEKPVLTDSEYQSIQQFYAEDAAKLAVDFGVNTAGWLTRR